MLVFKIVGSWARGLYLMGVGGFWMFITYYLSGSGRSMNGATLGFGGFGALLFCLGLVFVVRGILLTSQRTPLPQGSAGWRDDGQRAAIDSGFDPDAAIARYLERRPESPAAGPAVTTAAAPAAAPAAPPRPTFGRKQA